MRHLVTRLALAGTAALATVALPSATPAGAASPIVCSSIIGSDGLVATVCTTVLNGQVTGRLNPLTTGVTVDSLTLYKCNAAETSCTALATTTMPATPSFAAVAGKHYETCAFVHVPESPTVTRHYDGCSPFAVA
jgi:hypothetical protein